MATDDKLHIAMFPWLAFGHMIPFLELSKLIAQKGHKISFISTPRNIDRLPKLPPHLASRINFVKLPFPQLPNLPPGAEATIDVPLQDIHLLENAYDLLQEPLSQFLQTSLPDWILFDFSPYWLPSIAHKLNIPTVYFSIFIAACNCFACPPSGQDDYRQVVEDYTVAPNWVPFPSTIAYRHFESAKCLTGITGYQSNVGTFYRFQQSIKNCDLMAVRTCEELERDSLVLLENIHKKPIVPIGVLPTQIYDDEINQDEFENAIEAWFDSQAKASVVYVAFGSEAKPSQDELTKIALGLELSGLPFFWVVRTRRGPGDSEIVELPDGFEERTKGRGVVCTSWAPQLKILAHESVGGFLTHAGWSSAVEGLQFGRALVFLTFFADQGINAKFFVENKMGYLVPRDEYDGSFTSLAVAESLKLVVVEEEGRDYREKAMEMKPLFGNRDKQDRHVDEFLGKLKGLSNPK